MERKLIKQGLGGYTIYLPKKWLDSKGLKSGDKVNVTEKDNSLSITSEVKGKKEITLDLSDKSKENLKNILTHYYRKGYDKIKLNNAEKDSLVLIKNTVSNILLGFEITDKTINSCTIENISEPTGEKYEVILRRVFLIIKETQDLAYEDAKTNKFIHLKEIQELKDQQDKLVLFCRRLIVKEKTELNPLLNWELLTFLTHIQHSYYYLYKYVSDSKVRLSQDALKLLNNLKDYFELYYNSYYKKDIYLIHEINKLKNKFQFGECLRLLEKSRGKETIALSYIREIFRLIQVGTSPVLLEFLDYQSTSA